MILSGARYVAPRYLVVGGTCALLNAGVLIAGDALHLPLAASIAASFGLVCIIGYALHAKVTFGTRAHGPGFLRYVLAMTASLPMSAALLWLFVSAWHWPMALAAPTTTAIMLAVNFVSSRWAVTRPSRRIAGLPS